MSVTEKEIAAITVAPRVTKQDVDDFIVRDEYHVHGLLTFCILHLKNGFTVTGQSACASPANYNADIVNRLAREDAVNKIRPLLGFELRTRLALIENAGAPSGSILELGSPVTYVGTKVIHAVAMSRQAYNDYRGWQLPADENGEDNGYLVEYADGGQPNVPGHAGYISWSPAEVFEKAYGTPVRQEPETFITRLQKERDELVERLNKLNAFLGSPAGYEIEKSARDDLVLQAEAMTQYAFILSKRYDDLTADKG